MSTAAYYAAAQPHLAAARAAVARREEAYGSWQVSDIVDAQGHQYVDLVQEGGGVLGIALVGYTYVLEQLGVRFLQLGGTSAGAINALLLAAAGPVSALKTEWLLARLSEQDLNAFIDGDGDARDFVRVLVENGSLVRYLWKGAQVLDNLRRDFGLNPGTVFHEWLRRLLDERGISSARALREHRTLTPAQGLRERDGTPYAPASALRVALVATDITTESKVIFPEMARLYFADPDATHPADYVRASMSIPGFFAPFRVRGLPRAGQPGGADWVDATGYEGPVPETVLFLDGGLLSNFPIDLFHRHYQVPRCPTFGIKLGRGRDTPQHPAKFTQLLGQMLATTRHGHDYDFLTRNPDFRHLVSYADTDAFSWLDFGLSEGGKQALFAAGAAAAARFVARFDWAGYKQVRQQLLQVYQATNAVRPAPRIS